MKPGMFWLYGLAERAWCPDCGEVYPASYRDHSGHPWSMCEQKRFANWTEGPVKAWEPVPAVRLTP